MTNKLSLVELNALHISVLRKKAADLGLPLRRDMTAPQIAQMVFDSENGPSERIARVSNTESRPEPGYARIEILRDPSPHASNSDVFLGVNGYTVQIKRGMVVDVPIKILRGSLMNSVAEVLREDTSQVDPEKRYTWELVHTYPFTVYDINEGPDPRDTHERTTRRKMVAKRAFKKANGYWAKSAELRAWMADKDNHALIRKEQELIEKGE